MPRELPWFTVRLAIVGLSKDQSTELIEDLRQQVNSSPVLRNPVVWWEGDTQRAIVQMDTEGLTSDRAASQMAEELLELVSALLIGDIDELGVEILNVVPAHPELS
ncbi:MAG: hypothetical protein HYR71_06420 [Chloroflexi bacterium]|nr:hypothetical protein [Chloroflexota bacterium]